MRKKRINYYKACLVIFFSVIFFNCKSQNHELITQDCSDTVIIKYNVNDGDYSTIELPNRIKDNFNWVTIFIIIVSVTLKV